jgi:ABC-type sulfate transport system permease subunit
MQFTDGDRKLLAKVRRQDQLWRRFRGLIIAANSIGLLLFLAALVAGGLVALAALVEPDPKAAIKDAVFVAFCVPASLGGCMVCAWSLGNAIGRWSFPGRELLLRLAEDHAKTDA